MNESSHQRSPSARPLALPPVALDALPALAIIGLSDTDERQTLVSDALVQHMFEQMKSDMKDKAEQGAFSMINQQLMMLLINKTDLLADLNETRRESLERAINAALGLSDLMHNSASIEAYAELIRCRVETLNEGR